MKREILKAEHLSKTFLNPTKHEVLKDISLTIYAGETTAIMGPSGVGKSTLLHILGTLDQPGSGKLEISGQNALGDSASAIRNEHIGFIFQNFNLLDEYSVIENVLMPARIGRQTINLAHAKKLLKRVNLLSHAEHLAKQLSGGEKQRVAIARALCNDPDLILADEPSGNLDDANSKVIHELLIQSAKDLEKALIVVTHDKRLAALCDRIYTLHDAHLTSEEV